MIACYDLARCPPTYDVVAFLALAEKERLHRGEEYLDIRILPGPADGFRADSLWPHTVEERVQMRDKVLVPLCHLLPSVRSVEVVEKPRAGHDIRGCWGTGEYFIGLGAIVRALEMGSRPLRESGTLITGTLQSGMLVPQTSSKMITFTLREAAHYPLRNSRVEQWTAAAADLAAAGYEVCLIRDAARAHEPLSGPGENLSVGVDPGAATDIEERAHAYATALLNVGICNGPMWMSIFMDAPTLMLRPTTNEAGGCYDDSFYSQFGLKRGSQLPTSPPYQRLVWEEDTCDNIVRAVEDMLVAGELA